VNQLEEEFFRQGDVERQTNMPISPLFDRAKQGITKSQVGLLLCHLTLQHVCMLLAVLCCLFDRAKQGITKLQLHGQNGT
jgi:hypothetical protein